MPPRLRAGLALCVALAALLALRGLALAHAELVASEPVAGSTVPPGLARLILVFNEAPAPGSTIALYTGAFQPVAGVTSYVANGQLWADVLPALAAGGYTVQWTAISADGHSMTGSFQFAVAPAAPLAFPWVVVAGLLLGVVTVGAAFFVLMRGRRHRPKAGYTFTATHDEPTDDADQSLTLTASG